MHCNYCNKLYDLSAFFLLVYSKQDSCLLGLTLEIVEKRTAQLLHDMKVQMDTLRAKMEAFQRSQSGPQKLTILMMSQGSRQVTLFGLVKTFVEALFLVQ